MERAVEMVFADGEALEYSVVGKGEPVLVMHGGHSSCHEEFGFINLIKHGYKIITSSRAGYGRTSKAIGKDLSTACRHYLKLLDHLEQKKIQLLAVSAGGASGIFFASHYQERVKSLTLHCAVTKQWHTPADMEYKAAQVLFRPTLEKLTWKLISAMSSMFLNYMFKQFVPSFSEQSYREVTGQMGGNDLDALKKMNSRQRSGHGFLLDLVQTNKLSTELLQQITCPTLIMHSKTMQRYA